MALTGMQNTQKRKQIKEEAQNNKIKTRNKQEAEQSMNNYSSKSKE